MRSPFFYYSPEDAVKELMRRRELPQLEERVNDYLKGDIPKHFNDCTGPISMLLRSIFTPDYELEIFLKFADSIGSWPVLAEYIRDKFVANNEDKHDLGKLYFYLNKDAHGHVNMRSFKVIDFDYAEGKRICDIVTIWGESFVGFHHRILKRWHSEIESHIVDYSEWAHRNGGSAKEYYNSVFALFIRHAILFENFRESGPEVDFIRKVFIPTYQRVTDHFGMKPLICPIKAPEDENNPKWEGYPPDSMEYICEAARSRML